jgi:FtsZ-interacting cell division protein ZipA
MSKDTVKLFQRARAALQSEKDSLSKALANAQATAADAEKRLAEIEAALGGAGTAPAKRRGRKPKKAAGKRRGRPAKKTAAKRGRPAKKKAAVKQKTVKKKAAKRAPKKAVEKAAKKAPKKAVKKAPKKAAKKATAKKVKNKLSLKQVALAVTKGKALDAKQILEAAQKAGHKFSGKNPLNSLRVMLYTNKKAFKNDKGKFVAA